MAGHNNWPYIINLGNSIIGVAVLAMPFCFKQCGILLGMLVLLFCTWLTLTSCQLLMRAGIHSRRRSYEFLAYHTHGATGKLLSEVGMIGMQVGTLIAQIVVIGDLGPAIFSKFLGIQNTNSLRTFLILALCLGVGLPLGLLKDLRAVSRASTVCISFYCIFILYVIVLSLPHIQTGEWYPKVFFWRPEGFFKCLPILSFSFGCQTQLFLLYDALPEPSLKSITGVISSAVNLCAVAYLLVGFFGYVAFYAIDVPGDVISVFPNTFVADLMKICFVFSIVITFPVIIFPCRSSIYTLVFAKWRADDTESHDQKSKAHDDVMEADDYLPESLFKGITIFIVLSCMVLGILIPNVEFILGINGAIMGTLICYIFPAMFFLKVMGSKQEGRGVAKVVLILGVTILMLSTMAVLNSQGEGGHAPQPLDLKQADGRSQLLAREEDSRVGVDMMPEQLVPPVATVAGLAPDKDKAAFVSDTKDSETGEEAVALKDGGRQEPPNPDPPDTKLVNNAQEEKTKVDEKDTAEEKVGDKIDDKDKKKVAEKLEVIEKVAQANKEKELELKEKEKKQEELIQQLEKHREEQEKLLKEQRELLKEFKDHHEKDLKKEAEEPAGGWDIQKVQQGLPQQPQVVPQPQQQQAGQQPPLQVVAQQHQQQAPLNQQPQQAPLNQQPQQVLAQQQPVAFNQQNAQQQNQQGYQQQQENVERRQNLQPERLQQENIPQENIQQVNQEQQQNQQLNQQQQGNNQVQQNQQQYQQQNQQFNQQLNQQQNQQLNQQLNQPQQQHNQQQPNQQQQNQQPIQQQQQQEYQQQNHQQSQQQQNQQQQQQQYQHPNHQQNQQQQNQQQDYQQVDKQEHKQHARQEEHVKTMRDTEGDNQKPRAYIKPPEDLEPADRQDRAVNDVHHQESNPRQRRSAVIDHNNNEVNDESQIDAVKLGVGRGHAGQDDNRLRNEEIIDERDNKNDDGLDGDDNGEIVEEDEHENFIQNNKGGNLKGLGSSKNNKSDTNLKYAEKPEAVEEDGIAAKKRNEEMRRKLKSVDDLNVDGLKADVVQSMTNHIEAGASGRHLLEALRTRD